MTEEIKFSEVKANFIDTANKEIDFVKNITDVKEIEWYEGDGKKIIGLDEDKQEFFLNGEEIRDVTRYTEDSDVNFLYYKHKDGTEVFLQTVQSEGYYSKHTALLVKGQECICFDSVSSNDAMDNSDFATRVSISKLGQEMPDARLTFYGTNMANVRAQNPDLYNLYNRYVPQDINTENILLKLNRIKEGWGKSQQIMRESDNKVAEANLFKSALDKWNSGR